MAFVPRATLTTPDLATHTGALLIGAPLTVNTDLVESDLAERTRSVSSSRSLTPTSAATPRALSPRVSLLHTQSKGGLPPLSAFAQAFRLRDRLPGNVPLSPITPLSTLSTELSHSPSSARSASPTSVGRGQEEPAHSPSSARSSRSTSPTPDDDEQEQLSPPHSFRGLTSAATELDEFDFSFEDPEQEALEKHYQEQMQPLDERVEQLEEALAHLEPQYRANDRSLAAEAEEIEALHKELEIEIRELHRQEEELSTSLGDISHSSISEEALIPTSKKTEELRGLLTTLSQAMALHRGDGERLTLERDDATRRLKALITAHEKDIDTQTSTLAELRQTHAQPSEVAPAHAEDAEEIHGAIANTLLQLDNELQQLISNHTALVAELASVSTPFDTQIQEAQARYTSTQKRHAKTEFDLRNSEAADEDLMAAQNDYDQVRYSIAHAIQAHQKYGARLKEIFAEREDLARTLDDNRWEIEQELLSLRSRKQELLDARVAETRAAVEKFTAAHSAFEKMHGPDLVSGNHARDQSAPPSPTPLTPRSDRSATLSPIHFKARDGSPTPSPIHSPLGSSHLPAPVPREEPTTVISHTPILPPAPTYPGRPIITWVRLADLPEEFMERIDKLRLENIVDMERSLAIRQMLVDAKICKEDLSELYIAIASQSLGTPQNYRRSEHYCYMNMGRLLTEVSAYIRWKNRTRVA